VCNTDPSTKPGRHWIAIYVDEDGGREYFDSFGRNEHWGMGFQQETVTEQLLWILLLYVLLA
jgi:hypothetical protein